VENPKNGEIMGVVAEGDKADIDAAVAVAQQAFGQWGEFSGRERGDIIASAACRRDPVRRLCWQRPDLSAGRAPARAS